MLAELLGSPFLATVVIGSGIAARQLSPHDTGLELFENAAATGAAAGLTDDGNPPDTGGHETGGWIVRRQLAVVAGLAALAIAPSAARAATIVVNTTADGLSLGAGQCSLREAIASVNSPGTQSTGCAQPSATDNTIVLGPGPYKLSIPPPERMTTPPAT